MGMHDHLVPDERADEATHDHVVCPVLIEVHPSGCRYCCRRVEYRSWLRAFVMSNASPTCVDTSVTLGM